MQIELLDFLNLLWAVAGAAFVMIWRRVDRTERLFADRADVVNKHETRIAVLETRQADTTKYFEKIEGHLERIEEKLDAKADK